MSAEVIAELSHPSFKLGQDALDVVADIARLPITNEIRGVARVLVDERVMPGPVAGDAIHVAIAAVNELDYMLSWNVRHLANPNKLDHLREVCRRLGLVPPLILTPDMLWEAQT